MAGAGSWSAGAVAAVVTGWPRPPESSRAGPTPAPLPLWVALCVDVRGIPAEGSEVWGAWTNP